MIAQSYWKRRWYAIEVGNYQVPMKQTLLVALASMFLSEREVIRRLGIPRSAFVSDGGEIWSWEMADGSEVLADFNNGRLLRLDR